MKEYPFNTIYPQIVDLYGVEMGSNLYESIAMTAWEKIGNKRTKMYRHIVDPYWDEFSQAWVVDLPCNCEILESVHRIQDSVQQTSPTQIYPDTESNFIESYAESRKINRDVRYTSGELINYELACNKIYISENFGPIQIVYKGVFYDEDGLPYLNNKEINAIAAYCIYISTFRKGLQTHDNATIQLSALLKQDWEKLCSAARVPEYITQNEMDTILDAKTSWDRKQYKKII